MRFDHVRLGSFLGCALSIRRFTGLIFLFRSTDGEEWYARDPLPHLVLNRLVSTDSRDHATKAVGLHFLDTELVKITGLARCNGRNFSLAPTSRLESLVVVRKAIKHLLKEPDEGVVSTWLLSDLHDLPKTVAEPVRALRG